MNKETRIFLAGDRGLIGSALARRLRADGYTNVITRRRAELDLRDGLAVDRFFQETRPEVVLLAAGRVGGITANLTYPAEFITENLEIELNAIRSAHKAGVERLVFFGSSCMYPRECPQPMAESALLAGIPEPTSLPYALAKLSGVQLCLAYNQQYQQSLFIPVIPNNAFGPHDDFDPKSSHVLSALIRRFHEAKVSKADTVTLWGTGKPRREFIFSDDIADAVLFLVQQPSLPELPINVGTGVDCEIRELAAVIAKVVGFQGKIEQDTTKPDGAPRKLLDSQRLLSLGWRPRVSLEEGIRRTYDWYLTEGL